MESQEIISFTLSLIKSSGLFGRVGSPDLFCWAKALHLPGSYYDDGYITVLSRDWTAKVWREYKKAISIEQSREIIELLTALGLPDRIPEVDGVMDTSDGWSHISFETRIDDKHSHMEIPMNSSGFEGRDAARLRRLFCYLFDIAGYVKSERGGYSIYEEI